MVAIVLWVGWLNLLAFELADIFSVKLFRHSFFLLKAFTAHPLHISNFYLTLGQIIKLYQKYYLKGRHFWGTNFWEFCFSKAYGKRKCFFQKTSNNHCSNIFQQYLRFSVPCPSLTLAPNSNFYLAVPNQIFIYRHRLSICIYLPRP